MLFLGMYAHVVLWNTCGTQQMHLMELMYVQYHDLVPWMLHVVMLVELRAAYGVNEMTCSSITHAARRGLLWLKNQCSYKVIQTLLLLRTLMTRSEYNTCESSTNRSTDCNSKKSMTHCIQ